MVLMSLNQDDPQLLLIPDVTTENQDPFLRIPPRAMTPDGNQKSSIQIPHHRTGTIAGFHHLVLYINTIRRSESGL